MASGSCVAVRRDTGEKRPIPLANAASEAALLLERIQGEMLTAALERREAHTVRGELTYEQFREIMEGEGAFVFAGWNGDPAVEARVKEETKATIRCIPDPEFRSRPSPSRCMVTGEPAKYEVVWAKAY